MYNFGSTPLIDMTKLRDAVETAYLENGGSLEQSHLYKIVSKKLNLNPEDFYTKVGSQNKVNILFRKVRWLQQSLKEERLLTRIDKGLWEVTGKAKEKLHTIEKGKSVIAMSTTLGVMICSKTESVFSNKIIEEDIDLVLSSPPYILQNPRLYGGPTESREWCKFIMGIINQIKPRLADGCSIALNVGQDCFHPKQPTRQTHIERLVLEMEDAGFWLVDRLIWQSNKAPGPYLWTSKERFMLKNSFEFVLHFTNNPFKLKSSNQRVLLPHSESHKAFVRSGGTKKAASNSDGAHRKSAGDYANTDLEKGKLASNVLYFPNKCRRNEEVNRYADAIEVVRHGAKFPYSLVEFLVRYLCPEGGLVLDPFGGTGTVASACENTNRRWISIEPVIEYIQQSFVRFKSLADDVWFNPEFLRAA